MKKSIGAKIRFTDGHEEEFIGVTDVEWRVDCVHLSRKMKNGDLDCVASVDRKYVIGVFDIYEQEDRKVKNDELKCTKKTSSRKQRNRKS